MRSPAIWANERRKGGDHTRNEVSYYPGLCTLSPGNTATGFDHQLPYVVWKIDTRAKLVLWRRGGVMYQGRIGSAKMLSLNLSTVLR